MRTALAQHPASFPKPTGAVEISEPTGALTLADRQLWNHLLAGASRTIASSEWHSVRLSEIRRFAAEARGGAIETDNRRMKESVQRLQQTVVAFNYLDSDRGAVWESSQLLGTCRYLERDQVLEYSFPSGLRERLVEPALYSMISLRVQYQFDSKYGLQLYEVLKRYADRNADVPWWSVKTSELRDLLGCRTKLPDWKDFRRRALDPAMEEIGRLAEFTLTMDELRQGRGRGGGQVVGVTFRIRRKDREEAAAAVRELEKPRSQRRGEAKVRAEDVIAQKAIAFLHGSDHSTRLRWAKRAEELGVKMPRAPTAREQLAQWVPVIASVIVTEERLR